MHESRTDAPSRWTCLLLCALVAALLLLRSPGILLHAQFWAEDGTLFFQEAFNRGFLKTILQPASGYLHTFPRLVAGLSLLLPLELAPLVFNLAAFAVQLLPACYLLSRRLCCVIPSFFARAAAALLCIAVPASFETHANLTNAHWHLALAAVCILVAAPAVGTAARALETLAVLLFSVTGPFSILFLPLVAPRLLRAGRGAPADRSLTIAVVIAGGAAVQAAFALTSARVGAGASRFGYLPVQDLVTAVSMHTFFNAILGVNGFSAIAGLLPRAAYGLGLLGLAFLVFVAVRDRVGPLLILLYLAALSIALWYLFPLNDPRIWLNPQSGSRYFLFACLFILLTLLHLALTASPFRAAGLVLLGVAVAIGIPADFSHPRQPDVRWADNAAVFRSLPAGSAFSIPVVPLYHPPLVLHKRTPARGPSPLDRLRPVASGARAFFSVTRPRRASLNEASNSTHLRVSGWAITGEKQDAEPAGGVFVLIDEKVFPAVYGLPAQGDPGGGACADCGFSRLVPIAEIGPGTHTVSIVVLTPDRTGFSQPAPPQSFAVSDLFP